MAETQTWRVVLASGEVREVATPQGTRGDATRVAIVAAMRGRRVQ